MTDRSSQPGDRTDPPGEADHGTPPGGVRDVAARVVLRPLANPLPLGFLALAAATTVVAAQQLRWVPLEEGPVVGLVLLAFVFPTQLLASILGFLARDIAAGTGMGLLAGTWLSVALVSLAAPFGLTSRVLALLLWVAGAAMLVPAAAGATGKIVPTAVLATTALRFAVTGGYEWTGSDGWRVTAGVVGLVLAVLAAYAALAMALEDAWRRTVLPVARHAAGREAMGRDLDAQVTRIGHEAGVRDWL
ncbi:MAG TPA: GPR1/FUN34/YaaH family transporter [Natronosporangium sp.]|nr:GPR1/FUN34/YaaH family transporter [Natronosporangium sp.]